MTFDLTGDVREPPAPCGTTRIAFIRDQRFELHELGEFAGRRGPNPMIWQAGRNGDYQRNAGTDQRTD